MNNEKLYLTIDTKLLKSKMPEDTTLELKKEIEECYTKVCLKNITIRTSSPWLLGRGERCFRIHCSILNKNDNLINGEQSDVIALLFCRLYSNKLNNSRLGNTGAKLIKKHSKNIRIFLTDDSNALIKLSPDLEIKYELEFSQ